MRPSSTGCACMVALLGAGCGGRDSPGPSPPGTDAGRGRAALERFDCDVCHVIPGVAGIPGQVGPSLEQYARRAYVAGKFPNEHDYLVRWIIDPPALAPRTAMPAMGVSEAEARDMAAYLQALR